MNNLINITENNNQTIKVENKQSNETITINVTNNISEKTILVFLNLTDTVNIKYQISQNVKVNIINIYKNKASAQTTNISYDILNNSVVNAYHLNIVNNSIEENVTFNLLEKRSKINFYLASLAVANNKKNEIIYAHHLSPQTESNIRTYSIAKDKATQSVKCSSHIEKTMAKSEAHQELRLLVFDKTAKAISDPILLIDENDIKASHANALGMLDPEQVFYLQTRGLTPNQARKLICMGYFKNVIEAIVDENLQQDIMIEIDNEIGE